MTMSPIDGPKLDGAGQTTPPTPQTPPRNRLRLAITAASIGALAVLGLAAVAGHGVWSTLAEWSSQSPLQHEESLKPGHGAQPSPNRPLDGLDVSDATDQQKVGLVTILTDLAYSDGSQAAGTGSILTSDGEVLTNNHVIEGSAEIEVTIESTGETYQAVVLGTDKTNDVALLQILDVEGLQTVDLSLDDVAVGDDVASIGNAQGTGDLVVAEGTVTGVDQSLSISNDYGGQYEKLTGLIEVNADVVSGDSGGPLVDQDGDVVGMVTAASSGDQDIFGYAITIGFAMDVVKQIESGEETGTVNIGPTAFMGVTLDENQGPTGVLINGALAGTPADKAGLVAGDTVTSFDGTAVNDIDTLKALVRAHDPGDVVSLEYTDESGVDHVVELTLTEGPA
jgi:S1-C subfamily serine protease